MSETLETRETDETKASDLIEVGTLEMLGQAVSRLGDVEPGTYVDVNDMLAMSGMLATYLPGMAEFWDEADFVLLDSPAEHPDLHLAKKNNWGICTGFALSRADNVWHPRLWYKDGDRILDSVRGNDRYYGIEHEWAKGAIVTLDKTIIPASIIDLYDEDDVFLVSDGWREPMDVSAGGVALDERGRVAGIVLPGTDGATGVIRAQRFDEFLGNDEVAAVIAACTARRSAEDLVTTA